MIRGRAVVVFGDQWGFHPTTTEHLVRRFLPENRVLWMHVPGTRAPRLSAYDLTRSLAMFRTWLADRPQAATPGLALCSPPLIPLGRQPWAQHWNRHAIRREIARHLEPDERPIVITSLPHAADVLDRDVADTLVYVCEDHYPAMPGAYRHYVEAAEQRLLDRVDMTFVTSNALVALKSTPRLRARFLPQGVDYEHFSHAPSLAPDELAGVKTPMIGFVGVIASWVDLELIAAVARAFRSATVVVIGPARIDARVLTREPNVRVVGQRPYRALPAYLHACSVGLIPFKQNELTRYVNPLKLLEYFAAGMPVVSTPLPDLDAFGDLIYVASGHDEFIHLVGKALAESSIELTERRRAVARAAGWDVRAEQISAAIEQHATQRQRLTQP